MTLGCLSDVEDIRRLMLGVNTNIFTAADLEAANVLDRHGNIKKLTVLEFHHVMEKTFWNPGPLLRSWRF